MKNKLYTKSYFTKRLIEAGFFIKKVIDYKEEDIRRWTIIVDPDNKNLLITCFKKQKDNFYFLLQIQEVNIKLYTKSMEVVIDSINNILNPKQITIQ